ncbi:MAG: hypothetical protein WCD70_11600 [Alphaproteobacteria bacterium]
MKEYRLVIPVTEDTVKDFAPFVEASGKKSFSNFLLAAIQTFAPISIDAASCHGKDGHVVLESKMELPAAFLSFRDAAGEAVKAWVDREANGLGDVACVMNCAVEFAEYQRSRMPFATVTRAPGQYLN